MAMLPLQSQLCNTTYEEFYLSYTFPGLIVFPQLLVLVTQLAVASTTITIGCALNGC